MEPVVSGMYGYVYLIVNKINGKTYVGQRKSTKACSSDKYMGSGKHLKCAQKKYGIENFEKFLIQYCNSKEELDKQEIFWIAEYKNRGKAEYNICAGGRGGCGIGEEHYNYGKHLSEETKRKISEANKGKKLGPYSKERVEKAASAHRGKKVSEEGRKHIAEAHIGQIPWNKGKQFSEETRRKMAEARKGKEPWNKGLKTGPLSEEHKSKISESCRRTKNERK